MTDNEIIKALECCGEFHNKRDCSKCPYCNIKIACSIKLKNDALDLINRQKAEIERLEETKNRLSYNLQAVLDERADHSEAVKEFEERAIKNICEKVYAPTPVQSCIVEKCNQVITETVKEMVGES